MIRRGALLVAAAAVAAMTSVAPAAAASGRCYNTEPATPGSVASCIVVGVARYGVVATTQWELRVYRGQTCTGLAEDIDTTVTRAGRTPSAGVLDLGLDPRCVALRLTGAGAMAIDAEEVA